MFLLSHVLHPFCEIIKRMDDCIYSRASSQMSWITKLSRYEASWALETCPILRVCASLLWVVSSLLSCQTCHSCWSSRSSVLTIGEAEQFNASCRGTLMHPPSRTSPALFPPPLCLISPPVYFLGYVGWNAAITNQRLWIISRKKPDYSWEL